MTIFFDSWDSIGRIIITILFIYPSLIIMLKIAGKRSLSKLNMFDFIITVALGSIFGAVIIYKSITFMDGIVSTALLLLAQALISRLSIEYAFVDKLIKPNPTVMFLNGDFLDDAMKSVRVTKSEVYAEVRQAGLACMDDVYAVVLETNGVISVLKQKVTINNSTLVDVANYDAN